MLALAALVALSLSGAALAAATPDFSSISVRSARVILTQPAQNRGVSAQCKDGTNAVSSGFTARKPLKPQFHGPVVTSSTATGKKSWAVRATEFANDPYTEVHDRLILRVYCAARAPKLTTESAAKTLQSNVNRGSEYVERGRVTVDCPANQEAVSGGFKTHYFLNQDDQQVDGIAVESSYRSGRRSWSVDGFPIPGGSPTKLTAYVYCGKVQRLHAAKASATATPTHISPVATARCSSDYRVISGGFKAGPTTGAGLSVLAPQTSRRLSNGRWRVRGLFPPITPDTSQKLTTYAYCAKR